MTTWPAAIAAVSLASAAIAAAWFTWQARRITAPRYWINGQPVTEREWEDHVRRATGSQS
ncbi:hypothetical protein [Streptomyces sp. NPDC059916]|uniref:hypothetical protein n=1 Tax=Streptomyces sp. NPDC059916 TaxID=3347001 RepID=UPI0036B9BCC4